MEKMKDGPQRVCVSRSEAGGCGLSIKAERTRTPPLGTRLLSVGFILTLTLCASAQDTAASCRKMVLGCVPVVSLTRAASVLPADGACHW